MFLNVSLASAQKMNEADVPASVKSAFAKKYPGAKVEKWEKEGRILRERLERLEEIQKGQRGWEVGF